jgi:hypothetical protein
MFAGAYGSDGPLEVQAIGQRDEDGVDVGIIEYFWEMGR